MNETNLNSSLNEDIAKLILRFTVAVLMLFHGVAKIQHGIDPMMGMLVSKGLPSFIAYGVYVGEILAPIMLILGYRVKVAASLIIITIITAVGLAYADKVFVITKHGAWAIELHMFYILTSLSIVFLGAGRYSIDKK